MSDAIVLEGVKKTFGPKVAVRDMNLTVPVGALYGFIGPNGAGKTTTIRMIMSILFPDVGRVSVLGHPSALEAKDRIGYLPEERGVYKKMKVGQFLSFMSKLKGVPPGEIKQRVQRWLSRVDLAEVEHKRCEELSKGMQQKVQFIAAVIHEPDLLILDEPFSGLDPVNMRLLRDLVLEQHGRGATVVFSTHVMVQAEQICDHIVMIHDGNKVLDDGLTEIRARHDPHAVLFEPYQSGADLSPIERISGVANVVKSGARAEIVLADGADPAGIIREVSAVVPAAHVEIVRPTLEDIFIDIVKRGGVEEDAASLRAALRADGAARQEVGV